MPKWLTSKYSLAAIVGVILGIFGAAQQLDLELMKAHPEAARVLGAFLIGIALFVDILPRPAQIVGPNQAGAQQRIGRDIVPDVQRQPPPHQQWTQPLPNPPTKEGAPPYQRDPPAMYVDPNSPYLARDATPPYTQKSGWQQPPQR